MKKLVLAAFALTTAASVFAQGTIIFSIRSGAGTAHIYAPLAPGSSVHQVGLGATDSPAGATDWSGYSLIGANGASGKYGYGTTFAQLLGANGANAAESSLTPQGNTTTFRSGTSLGAVANATQTLQGIPPDAEVATLEMVAWDNSSGLYSTWALASAAWEAGLIAAGKSGAFNVNKIGGSVNLPPQGLPIGAGGMQSFNLYFIPEPSTFALAGLGAAAMLIFRRRK